MKLTGPHKPHNHKQAIFNIHQTLLSEKHNTKFRPTVICEVFEMYMFWNLELF